MSQTDPYQGDPDDWGLDDPKHGYNVPDSVRRGGATRPLVREEIGERGVSLRAASYKFECEECGNVRRFATSSFESHVRCDECQDLRWYQFSWALNRGEGA